MNVVENKTLARLDGASAPFTMPMGRRVWHLESPVCQQPGDGGVRTLVLTPCPSGSSYTCDDATCIPLEYRCDLKYDCLDRSDEAHCEVVNKPQDYKMDLPPRFSISGSSHHVSGNRHVLPVTVEMTIVTVAIHTMDMTMKLSYEMKMTVYDNRLSYRNLKSNLTLNQVTFSTMRSLWSPTVDFFNTETQERTKVDSKTSLYLTQQQLPKHRDTSAPGEGEAS